MTLSFEDIIKIMAFRISGQIPIICRTRSLEEIHMHYVTQLSVKNFNFGCRVLLYNFAECNRLCDFSSSRVKVCDDLIEKSFKVILQKKNEKSLKYNKGPTCVVARLKKMFI